MANKFGRNYKFIVEGSNGQFIDIELPLSIDFTIERNYYSSANSSSVTVFNLSRKKRELIAKDYQAVGFQRRAELLVGYRGQLSRIGYGNLQRAFSRRTRADYETTVDFFDGGWSKQRATSNFSVPRGTTIQNVVNRFVDDLVATGLKKGAIGTFSGSLSRGQSYSGNSLYQLNVLTDDAAYIDNGFINVVGDSEGVTPALRIDSNSGLLGSPIRESTYITFEMLMEPKLYIGQIVNLQSRSGDRVNGLHKVYAITHHGRVSETTGGEMITRVGLLNSQFHELRRG